MKKSASFPPAPASSPGTTGPGSVWSGRGGKIIRRALIGTCLAVVVSGCARFTVPAPAAPVREARDPAVEDSTLSLDVSITGSSIERGLDRLLPGGRHDGADRFAGAVRDFLRRQSSKIASGDGGRNLLLSRQLAVAWDALQNPLRISDALFLVLDPRSVSIASREARDGSVGIVAAIVARPKLATTPLPEKPATPLPPFTVSPAPAKNGFHLLLDSELSFDFLGRELTAALSGREYALRGARVVVEKVGVSASGEFLVLAVDIRGSVAGTLYLTGTPAYDDASRSLVVRNTEYTVETKQVLANIADWMLHGGLRDDLAARAAWYVGDRIDSAKGRISRALNHDFNGRVILRGNIASLRFASVGLTPRSFRAVLIADGAASLIFR